MCTAGARSASGHIAVVGAGVIGLAAAHRLARAGVRVTVLERDETGQGCSAGNLGWICPSSCFPIAAPGLRAKGLEWFARRDSPLYIKASALPALAPWLARFWRHCTKEAFDRGAKSLTGFADDTLKLYEELATQLGSDGFEWYSRGLVKAFRSADALADELALIERYGCGSLRRLDEGELLDLEPALPAGRYVGGLHVAAEAHVEPNSLTAALAASARALGAEIQEGFAVEEISFATGSRRAIAVRGEAHGETFEIRADRFLIASGAEAGRLAAACGTPIPLQAGKGYSITVTCPKVKLRHPVYLAEAKLGITPFHGALRAAGTLELSGINRDLDRRRLAAIESVAERGFPGVTRGGTRQDWVGMRPLTPDGLPVLGRLPSTDNVWLATGHQMLGITLAPASARLLATLLLGDHDSSLDPEATARFEKTFSPGRFS